MTTTAQPPSLAGVRALSGARAQAEVDEVAGAIAWIELHQVDSRSSDDVAIRDYGDGELLLAGDGAPTLSEAAVVELITTLRKSDAGGRRWLGKALEVKYRLPRLWDRMLDGEVDVWRAMKIADSTISLPFDAAAFVDNAVAGHAHSMSWAQLERTVEAARALYDPEEVERRRTKDARRLDVHLDQTGTDGFVPFDGLLDYADARDLEAAVAARAAKLAESCDEPYDVRRAMALGEICRGELALDGSNEGRGVTLYVHLDDTAVAEVDGHPVLVDQVAEWCGGAEVTIKPVIDLNEAVGSGGYEPSAPVAERVRLAWPQCVFPFCTRRARRADLDHRIPWPDGPTCSTNLGPLCRTHHRMKTHSGWSYEPAATTEHGVPTAFTWTSPSGTRFRVDRYGSMPLPPDS